MPSGRQLLLGLDVGTTATKAVLFDLRGTAIAASTEAYGLITPRDGWVEQDPQALWRAVIAAVRRIVAQMSPTDRVVALSLASQGGTTIPVDGKGRPTYRAISWMDARAGREADHLRITLGADTIRTTTGWPLGPTLPLQHIAWLRAHDPEVFRRTDRFLFVNDFITERLTGERAMNPSDATMTQLCDIAAASWDDRLLKAVGIERDHLSPILPSGEIVGKLSIDASGSLGLPPDVIVANGAHDQYCAAVGTGVTRPGKVLLSCGTAWVLLAVPENLQCGLDSGLAMSCHAVPGRWGGIRSLGAIGASLEWFVAQIWRRGEDVGREGLYASLNARVAAVPPGARELFFFPLSGGHVGTHSGGGGFVHLTLSHTRDEMARAVMEGTAFELRWAIDEIRTNGVAVEGLTMVGGAAESHIWPQIVADVTALPVVLPDERQAAARGAAILAGIGAGIFADAEAGFAAFRGDETELAPEPGVVRDYDQHFERYQQIYEAVMSGNHEMV